MLIRPAREQELQTSLGILLAQQGQSRMQLQSLVGKFLQYTREQGLCLDLHWVCEIENQLVASCLGILTGGRTALIMMPSVRLFGRWRAEIVELLKHVLRAGSDHNLRLLQALLDPSETENESTVREAGFVHLADLLYLERKVPQGNTQINYPANIEWIPYGPKTHGQFAQTIENTYEGSFDCVGLNGLRDVEDIIETHKASGVFTPETWWLACIDSEPAGVILLSQVPHQSALEVVYMGVLPRARGQRIGDALLTKADQAARAGNFRTITLAVDETNTPAGRLYDRHRFQTTGKRRAFIGLIDAP